MYVYFFHSSKFEAYLILVLPDFGCITVLNIWTILWKHLSHIGNLFGTETVSRDLDIYALDIHASLKHTL
jgi:hypothetical protein